MCCYVFNLGEFHRPFYQSMLNAVLQHCYSS